MSAGAHSIADRYEAVRVLVVDHSPVVWGAERSLLDMAPLLRDRGIEPTLASPSGPLAVAWQQLGFPHIEYAVTYGAGLRGDEGRRPPFVDLARLGGSVVAASARLARLARGIDVLHSHSLWANVEVVVAGKLGRTPVVLDLHDLVRPGLGRGLLRWSVRSADAAVAVSRAVATCAGDAGRPIRVLHRGVDLDRFRPGPRDPKLRDALGGSGAPLVGVLGRLDPEKGIDVVARAVAALTGDAAATRLVVVGAPHVSNAEQAAELRGRVTELLGDRVRFCGPRDDVPEVLRALDVLVNASTAEPMGRTVIEAQACEVPVVAMCAGGTPEIVEDGVTGLLVPPGDWQAMAGVLERLVTDAGLRARLGSAGRRQVETAHDWPSRCDAFAAVYRSVAHR